MLVQGCWGLIEGRLGITTYGLDVLALGGFGRHLGGLLLSVVVALRWC
jgi:hypothetical protein